MTLCRHWLLVGPEEARIFKKINLIRPLLFIHNKEESSKEVQLKQNFE
jgi:hypothetical protein